MARIVADFERGGKKHAKRLILEHNQEDRSIRFRKQALLNGVSKRFGDLYGQFNAVGFATNQQDRGGSPSDRRRYLDEVLCQIEPDYSRHMIRYNKVNTQRNAL